MRLKPAIQNPPGEESLKGKSYEIKISYTEPTRGGKFKGTVFMRLKSAIQNPPGEESLKGKSYEIKSAIQNPSGRKV